MTFAPPRVYCASPAHRFKMWNTLDLPGIRIVSTWHTNSLLADHEADPQWCREAWERDTMEIRQADVVLAYAEHKDRPNGTLFELGYAVAMDTPVALVGNFEWGTWKHLPLVTHYASLRLAIADITGVSPDDPS